MCPDLTDVNGTTIKEGDSILLPYVDDNGNVSSDLFEESNPKTVTMNSNVLVIPEYNTLIPLIEWAVDTKVQCTVKVVSNEDIERALARKELRSRSVGGDYISWLEDIIIDNDMRK